MRKVSPAGFLKAVDGSTTVEFVVVFLGFIAIMFFVVEVTLYMFFLASLEKAAEAGVRRAVVSPPVLSVNLVNQPTASRHYGARCTPERCVSWNERGCGPNRGQPCSGRTFNEIILPEMRRFNGQIRADNVSITYRYTGIGFAGGPAAPMVTATISCVPFQAGILGLLLGDGGGANGVTCSGGRALPPRSASMTGENLGRAL